MEINQKEIKERIKVYENKLKKLRQLSYNEEIKTCFNLEVCEQGGVNLDEIMFKCPDSDGEDFTEFKKFISDGDIIQIKLVRLND